MHMHMHSTPLVWNDDNATSCDLCDRVMHVDESHVIYWRPADRHEMGTHITITERYSLDNSLVLCCDCWDPKPRGIGAVISPVVDRGGKL